MKEFVLRGRGPNTMTLSSLKELQQFLSDNPDQPLLISGEGRAFSAGLDLDALIRDAPRVVSDLVESVIAALFLHPAPTVAAVNGHAIAGGCALLQACDLRIARADPAIKIGMPGVALGINYPPKLACILRYRIATSSLDRVLLEADNHTPEQALQLGLLDHLAEDEMSVARERLTHLAGHPRDAYAEAKRVLRAQAVQVSDAEQAHFDAQFAAHWNGQGLGRNRRDKRGAR